MELAIDFLGYIGNAEPFAGRGIKNVGCGQRPYRSRQSVPGKIAQLNVQCVARSTLKDEQVSEKMPRRQRPMMA